MNARAARCNLVRWCTFADEPALYQEDLIAIDDVLNSRAKFDARKAQVFELRFFDRSPRKKSPRS